MIHIRSYSVRLMIIFSITLGSSMLWEPASAQEPGKVKSIYSPLVRVEPEKGFIMVTTGSGILWVEASEAAKPHLKTLAVGDMIDIVVQFRDGNRAPVLVTWKLASSESPCKHFDGQNCQRSEDEQGKGAAKP